MRREAENEGNKIKKQNAKLRSNAIFGRSIENPINKVDVKIVTIRKQYLRWSFNGVTLLFEHSLNQVFSHPRENQLAK